MNINEFDHAFLHLPVHPDSSGLCNTNLVHLHMIRLSLTDFRLLVEIRALNNLSTFHYCTIVNLQEY